jgi:hypothetical protein
MALDREHDVEAITHSHGMNDGTYLRVNSNRLVK